jgi:hypothetical protein
VACNGEDRLRPRFYAYPGSQSCLDDSHASTSTGCPIDRQIQSHCLGLFVSNTSRFFTADELKGGFSVLLIISSPPFSCSTERQLFSFPPSCFSFLKEVALHRQANKISVFSSQAVKHPSHLQHLHRPPSVLTLRTRPISPIPHKSFPFIDRPRACKIRRHVRHIQLRAI